MSDLAINIEGLGKRYRIGGQHVIDRTLKEKLNSVAVAPFRALRSLAGRNGHNHNGNGDSALAFGSRRGETIWALKDVSLEVKQGEVVGLIGRNGAGKSTLLKILSRITEPTEGYADINGRVASLLEVGTGFQVELTGRENIYLNGSILGMKHAEIRRKFDEIVSFAEVEKFIDTPVKHYSSGMYMRLAFAVAAHLEPEILLIDEVLAVGDAAFQKKCLGKMEEVGAQGRTVLFVSHNVQAITRLCPRTILLDSGKVICDGESQKVTRHYLRSDAVNPAERKWDPQYAPGDAVAQLNTVRVLTKDGIQESIDIREPIQIEVEYFNFQNRVKPTAVVHVINEDGICLFASNDWNNKDWWNTPRSPGPVRSVCTIPGNFLAEGQFFVLVAICSYNPNEIHALERDVVSFQVVDRTQGDGVRGEHAGGKWPGVIRPLLEWEVFPEFRSTVTSLNESANSITQSR
jgi:lipopolysaccharide transport system ATP-binding protein